MGDEVMATFPTADDALNAAAQMQRQIIDASRRCRSTASRSRVRIGCHFGPVVLESRDVFGATVHTANRMTSQAKSGQIMTTAATVERLSPEWRASVRQIDIAMLKGQGAEVTLYEVLWQTDDVTSMLPSIALGGGNDRKAQRLRLVLGRPELVIDEPAAADHHRPRRRERPGDPRQPDLAHPCAHRDQPRQVPADRPEHQRHVRAADGRRGILRAPRQHAAQGRRG